MKAEDFVEFARLLTGRSVGGSYDRRVLETAIRDPESELDYTQFNELLLMLNLHRVERAFFEVFFGTRCKIADLTSRLERYLIAAMLKYGSFIFAFNRWSREASHNQLRDELSNLLNSTAPKHRKKLAQRPRILVDIERIPREDAYLVGEISALNIPAEYRVVESWLGAVDDEALRTWEEFISKSRSAVQAGKKDALAAGVQRFMEAHGDVDPADLHKLLLDARPKLEQLFRRLGRVQAIAQRNLDVYLTWDHMDVYFATSMRTRGEFESLHEFVTELMAHPELEDLRLRHFDPTQSKTSNRVDKGLVEALMLKRAECTIYSAQESDTLGKDSELAATLAQGKPVIAYVPRMSDDDVRMRAEQLLDSDLLVHYYGYSFICHSDDEFKQSCGERLNGVVGEITRVGKETQWKSLPAGVTLRELSDRFDLPGAEFARLWAQAEKRLYEKRAKVLSEFHPLSLQVNLRTGVANGLLIARTIDECAFLLRGIVTKTLRFYIEYDDQDQVWYLRESITKSPFRVVTTNERLTNSFWNFYLRNERKGGNNATV